MKNGLKIFGLLTVFVVALAPLPATAADKEPVTYWNPLTWGNGWSSKKTTSSKRPVVRNSKAESSAWEQVSNGTKSAATTTKHTLMPWTKPKPVQQPPLSGGRVKPTPKDSSGGSWWPSWLSSEEKEPKNPPSLTEWVGGKRPE